MPPKSLINLAPPISTERKKVATKHAIVPWFGEGMRGGSLGLWWSLNGKLVALLSLEHLSCILREEIPVVGLFPALFFHVSEESSRSLPLMRGWESGKTFSFTISVSDQIWCYLMHHLSSITYLITFLTSILLHIEAGRTNYLK